MIVRDGGDDWQVVLQIDHEDLSGAFARSWAKQASRLTSLRVCPRRPGKRSLCGKPRMRGMA